MNNLFEFVGKSITPEHWEHIGQYVSFYIATPDGGDNEVEFEYDLPESCTFTQHDFEENFGTQTKCNCCNHTIKRGAFFYNKSEQKIIYVGFDCAQNIINFKFDVEGAKKQTMAARKLAHKMNKINLILEAHEGLEEALKANNKIVKEINNKMWQFGNISDKQIDFVMKLAAQRKEYEQISANVPSGKIEGDFKVISQKKVFNEFTQSEAYKMLIQHTTENWKAWGNYKNTLEVGSIIHATIQIEPSQKDPLFGFYKRLSIKK